MVVSWRLWRRNRDEKWEDVKVILINIIKQDFSQNEAGMSLSNR